MDIADSHIRCRCCGENKLLDQFYPSIAARGKGECRSCLREKKRIYARENAEKLAAAARKRRHRRGDEWRAYKREYYKNNPETYRRYNLSRYNISPEEYDRLLASQGGGCACCGAAENKNGKRLFVDHCHESGAVRGILCHRCNSGIGSLGDDVKGLRRALAYLARAELKRVPPRMRINLLRGAEHVAS